MFHVTIIICTGFYTIKWA